MKIKRILVLKIQGNVIDDIHVSYASDFFFNDTSTTEIYTNLNTLSLHDALPIFQLYELFFRLRIIITIQLY